MNYRIKKQIRHRRMIYYNKQTQLENNLNFLPSKLERARDILLDMNLYRTIVSDHLNRETFHEMHNVYKQIRKEIIIRHQFDKGEFTKWYAFVRNRNNYLESFIN